MKNEQSDVEKLLSSLCEQARQLLDAEIASIFIRKGNKLILKAFSSDDPNRVLPIGVAVYSLGEGLTGYIGEGNPFRGTWEDIRKSPHWRGKWDASIWSERTKEPLSFLGVPIFFDEEAIGVLKVESAKDGKIFTDSSQRMLETIAELIATTLRAEPDLVTTLSSMYIFVLMPFADEFKDIYELGIKATAEGLGIRIERVDEIEFNDTILEQIYTGIQRADIVIADMTGRNSNVFYEVGYAHALSKEVILLTQRSDDIPFDLKGHNHIIYEGSITKLRNCLEKRLRAFQSNI